MQQTYAALEYTPEEFNAWLENQNKCKFSGKIYNYTFQKDKNSDCLGYVLLNIEQPNGFVFIKENFNFGGCTFDTYFDNYPDFTENDAIGEGNYIFGIMNPLTKKILVLDTIKENSSPEIPLCIGEKNPESLEGISFQVLFGIGSVFIILFFLGIFLYQKRKKK